MANRQGGRRADPASRNFSGTLPEGSRAKKLIAAVVEELRRRPDTYARITLREALGLVVASHPHPASAIRTAARRRLEE